MPKEKWKRREGKLRKKKEGMRVSGRSVFTLQEIIRRKAEEARRGQSRHKSKDKDTEAGNE
jgi:hypothetical protein